MPTYVFFSPESHAAYTQLIVKENGCMYVCNTKVINALHASFTHPLCADLHNSTDRKHFSQHIVHMGSSILSIYPRPQFFFCHRRTMTSPGSAVEPREAPAFDSVRDSSVVYVYGLTHKVRERHLDEIFGFYGGIIRLRLFAPLHERPHAFIEYENEECVDRAIAHMDQGQIDGARVTVSANDQPALCVQDRRRQPSRRRSHRRDWGTSPTTFSPSNYGQNRSAYDGTDYRSIHRPPVDHGWGQHAMSVSAKDESFSDGGHPYPTPSSDKLPLTMTATSSDTT